jgi:hypothetical protein
MTHPDLRKSFKAERDFMKTNKKGIFLEMDMEMKIGLTEE